MTQSRTLPFCAFLLAWWPVAAAPAAADVLALKNGERLSGSLVEVADGAVVFRPELAGLMIVESADTAWYVTEGFFQATVTDAGTRVGRFVREEGRWLLEGPEGTQQWELEGAAAVIDARSVAVELRETLAQSAPPATDWPALPSLNITGVAERAPMNLLDRRELLLGPRQGPAEQFLVRTRPIPLATTPLHASHDWRSATKVDASSPWPDALDETQPPCMLWWRIALLPPKLLEAPRTGAIETPGRGFLADMRPRLRGLLPLRLRTARRLSGPPWWKCGQAGPFATLSGPKGL